MLDVDLTWKIGDANGLSQLSSRGRKGVVTECLPQAHGERSTSNPLEVVRQRATRSGESDEAHREKVRPEKSMPVTSVRS